MATYKLGKLKLNLSKAGVAFRWGDGEIKRFPFSLKKTQGEDAADGLDQFDDAYEDGAQDQGYDDYAGDGAGDYGYDDGGDAGGDASYTYDDDGYADDGGYAGDGNYADSGYDDGNYADGSYDDGGYDDGNYADGGYDDSSYDDGGYDDGNYADSGYDDGNYADGGYAGDEGGYYDEDGNYIEGSGNEAPSFMQYIDENDWVTYVLLVLLPPLGIYLLWRRGRFDKIMRIGISVASALWFALLIFLIVSLISSGMNDPNRPVEGPTIRPVTPTPTVSALPSASVAPSGGVLPTASALPGVDEGIIDAPTATPLTGTGTGDATGGEYVWAGNTGLYYHSNRNCTQLGNDTPQYVSLEIAERRGLQACPTCYNQQIYYMTDRGTYYHTDPNCDGGTGQAMQGAYETTKERAEAAGKRACPVCAGGTTSAAQTSTDTMLNATAVRDYARTLSTDRSGVMVYATQGGTHFHTDPNCNGMQNASRISMLTALQNGKSACPDCCAVARNVVYCTEGGEWFHSDPTCQGMRNAQRTYVALALVMGKTPCPECLSGVTINLGSSSGSGTTGGSGAAGSDSSVGADGTVYVYATQGGEYYHTNSTCGGMRNAERVPLSTMLEIGRPACPDCCPTANNTVYATRGGTYYHSYATCSGMSGATPGTVAQALAAGFKKCPYCWTSSGSGSTSGGNQSGDTTQSVSGITVYCTDTGTWYHNDQTCQGWRSAYPVPLDAAGARGKTAGPLCCSCAARVVYAVSGGRYYHYDRNCNVEDLSRATSGTLARALMAGFARCPSCVDNSSGGGAESDPVSETYEPGTSGIRVYATQSGEYYHLSRDCAGSEASYITLETALNYGKSACPICARSTAERTVWSSRGDKYFHIYREHAGEGATPGTLAVAHAMGKEYCPTCLAHYRNGDEDVPTSSNTYTSGTSGLYVYATLTGERFHISADCPNLESGASRVTLETALNYGKSPCTTCANIARRTVYATSSSRYYHYSQTCAGSEATPGYLAIARAIGKQPCPVCVQGSSSGGNTGGNTGGQGGGAGGDQGGSAGGGDLSTATQVYIDLQGDSDSTIFHSHATCSRAGMRDGSMVVIDFVKDQGFSPCPYCWN